MHEENLALMKRAYEAFSAGDLDTIRAIGHEDEVWFTPGLGEFAPEYRGVDDIIEYLVKLAVATDGTFKDEPEMFLADEDRVTVIERVTAARKGRTLDTRIIHVYDITDGKVASVTEYDAEPKKVEAFWS